MDAKLLTLGFVLEKNKILLGMKKKGLGEGRWNGFGGKVEAGETIEEGMKREFFEECGLEVKKVEPVGKIEFSWETKPTVLEVHFFKVIEYNGEPKESEEMKPQWFEISKIPFEKMWKDDPYWMPLFLAGKKFKGKFLFNEKDEVIKHELKETTEF